MSFIFIWVNNYEIHLVLEVQLLNQVSRRFETLFLFHKPTQLYIFTESSILIF